ncbi:hypothetical protein AAFN47_02945 [Hoeflea sp. CAU 1731]
MPRTTQQTSDCRLALSPRQAYASGQVSPASNDAYFKVIAGSMGIGMLLAFALLVGLSFPESAALTDATVSGHTSVSNNTIATDRR